MKRPGTRLAIVTQDPANYGGVLRLAEYIYRRSEAFGREPTLVHYGRFSQHPELHVSFANLLRGELNLWPQEKKYSFRGMRAHAIGATFPEWEPNRLRVNGLWRRALSEYDAFILVTGSAQTGLPLVEARKSFVAWVSSTVETDRRTRLDRTHGFANLIEKIGVPSVRRAEQRVLSQASRVLAVSEDAKDHIAPIAGTAVELWPYPIDTLKFSPSPTPHATSPHRFLFVGRANDPRKRIELFFRACSAFRNSWPKVDFNATIVSSELSVPENANFSIEHIAHASEDELIDLYRSSTAFLLTSEQEGLGIAAMEAMACGLPVISTRCGGPETFIDDGISGFFVEDEPEAIAQRMYDLANTASLREKFSRAARERIEKDFSESLWNERFEALLLNLKHS